MNENPDARQCAVCQQNVNPDEALYSGEVEEVVLYFCSAGCKADYGRKAAPSKQEVEERSN